MPNLDGLTLATRNWPRWLQYGATVVMVLSALLVRSAHQSVAVSNVPGSPFLIFFLAIIVASALFANGAGYLSVALGAIVAKWFFIAPTGSLWASPPELLGLTLFVVIGLITASSIESLSRVSDDLSRANKRLFAAETEKALLQDEASHRFKNELAILGSLMRLEQRRVSDPDARASLRATSVRIRVLARLHERLERSENVAVIDTREFLTALCDDLNSAMIGMRPVDLNVEAQRHLIPQDQALSLGLIINELVVNALKHAFPGDQSGTITVAFQRKGELHTLVVADDGIGTAKSKPGQGRGLIASLVAKLQGAMTVEPSTGPSGTMVTVRFSSDKADRV